MKKSIAILFLLAATSFVANAQYSTAFGIRYNGGVGLTVKHNLRSNNALEGILTGYNNGINLTLLYEKHQQAFNSSNWRWYLGAGGHMGYWTEGYKGKWRPYTYDVGVNLGIDGIVGIEHTFDEIPLNISIDWKPGLNLIPSPILGIRNIGFSGRFTLK